MTNEEILKLAGRFFSKSWEHSMIEEGEDEWFYKAGESKLLKFALAIHEDGYNKGYDEGNEQHRSKEND